MGSKSGRLTVSATARFKERFDPFIIVRRMKRIAFSAVYKPEPEGGYSALCPELGVASQGETIEEAGANLKEAVELYLDSAKELGILKRVLEDAGIDIRRVAEHAPRALTGSIFAEVEA